MAKIKLTGHALGTGVLTVTAPNTSTDRTITLPDATGTLLNSDGSAANLTAIPAANITGTLPAISGASLTGVNAVNTGRKNMVINGAMQVSQRGDYTTATAITSHTYYLDRWQAVTAGVTGTIQDTGFASKLVATSSATGSLRFRSKFEEITYLSSKIVTLSCQMKSNNANSRINIYADSWQSATATHTGGGDWESISITLTLPAGIASEVSAHIGIDGALSADVSITSGDYCEIKDVQLELGSVATDFEHRSYGEELALCQRYAQVLGSLTAAKMRESDRIRAASWHFATTMRAAPTFPTVTTTDSIAVTVNSITVSGADTYSTATSDGMGGGIAAGILITAEL